MKPARVLVVDDKKNFLALFRRVAPAHLEIVCASNGLDALDALEAGHVDVVLSDVRMPGMDGLALLDAIKRRHGDVEVVLMTAFGTIRDAVWAMKRGAVEYLTKPFDPDDAIKAIDMALARRRRGPVPRYRDAIAAQRGQATREYLVTLLDDANGNVTRAAERAGVERESLHRLMKRYGIDAESFRPK